MPPVFLRCCRRTAIFALDTDTGTLHTIHCYARAECGFLTLTTLITFTKGIVMEKPNIVNLELEELPDNYKSVLNYIKQLEEKIDFLYDTIEDIQHYDCPLCKRIKGAGMSECTYCDWNVML